jgi:hypothetical protein
MRRALLFPIYKVLLINILLVSQRGCPDAHVDSEVGPYQSIHYACSENAGDAPYRSDSGGAVRGARGAQADPAERIF